MHETPKYLRWIEAERRAVEAAEVFFEAALDLEAASPSPIHDAGEVAALRAEADACYQAAMADLADLGKRPAEGEVVATNQLIAAEFVLLPTTKTVN